MPPARIFNPSSGILRLEIGWFEREEDLHRLQAGARQAGEDGEQDGRAGGCSWGAELQQSAADHCHDPSERCPTAIGACQRHYIDSTVICIVTLLPAVALFPSWPSRGRTSQMPLNSVIWAVRDMTAYLYIARDTISRLSEASVHLYLALLVPRACAPQLDLSSDPTDN